jgi:hypothetical protein
MRKLIWGALALAGALLFLVGSARAQTQTNVTATVVDPLGIPYANGTYSIQLIPTGTNPTVNGRAIGGAFNGTTDANGRFNVALWPNASIVPAATTWQFVVCTNPGGVPPPLGTGNQCTPPTAVTIAGASQDLSATLSAVARRLTVIFSGGSGFVTGSGASPEVAFWSSPSNLTGSTTFTWADGANSKGIFEGPPTSSLSANLQGLLVLGIPELQTNRWVKSTDSDTIVTGQYLFTQTDKNILTVGFAPAVDATNATSQQVIGQFVDSHINVPMGSTNNSTQSGISAQTFAYGAGTSATIDGFTAQNFNTGTGIINSSIGFNALAASNSGGGSITNSYGFHAGSQATVGTTLNADFISDEITTTGNNFAFYNTGGLSRFHFLRSDTYSSAAGILSSSFTAPTIAAGGCGGAGASIVSNNGTSAFKVSVGTGNGGTCAVSMPTATTDWVCFATDITTISTTVSQTRVTPTGTAAIVLSNFTDISGAANWVDNDVLEVSCHAE